MLIKRFADAKSYEAPNHVDIRALRLQGSEPGGPESFWVGLSHILPGGRAGPDTGSLEKVYVVISGEVTVTAEGQTQVLHALDSVRIGPNVERTVRNASNQVASMMVVMPYPPKNKP